MLPISQVLGATARPGAVGRGSDRDQPVPAATDRPSGADRAV